MIRLHDYPTSERRVGDLLDEYREKSAAIARAFLEKVRAEGDYNAERFDMAVSLLGTRILGALVRDVTCTKCGGNVAWMYERLVGTDKCMCLTCAEKLRLEREGKRSDDETRAWFERRRTLTQIPAEMLDVLGITPENAEDPPPKKPRDGRWKAALAAVWRYMKAPRRRTLVLSGDSGIGKTTAAAWACWRTTGLFLPRSTWTRLPVRAQDDSRLRMVIDHGGVVVIDNALDVRPGGDGADSDWEAEVWFQVVQSRHDEGRATIVTTQASRDEVVRCYGTHGEAIVRRAEDGHDLAGAPEVGGWARCVWVKPKEEAER